MRIAKGRTYLLDMLRYARLAADFVQGRAQDDLEADQMLQLAVVHALQTIGEAAKAIPEEVRVLAPDVPWRQIARTRDIIVHRYFGVNTAMVWQVTQQDLPALIVEIETLLHRIDDVDP